RGLLRGERRGGPPGAGRDLAASVPRESGAVLDLRRPLTARAARRYSAGEVTHPLLGKTSRALAIMVVLLAAPYASPRLPALRLTEAPWDHAAEAARDPAPREDTPAVGEATVHAGDNLGSVTNALPEREDERPLAKANGAFAIEDETGHAMDAFYTHLA